VFQNHSLLPWLTVYQNVAIAVNKVWRSKNAKGRNEGFRHNLKHGGT